MFIDRQTKTCSAQDTKAKFSEMLDNVEGGREQIITRHGKVVAKVVPFDGSGRDEGETGAALVALLDASPLKGSDIRLERSGRDALKNRKLDLR